MPCNLSTLRPGQARLDLPLIVELLVARVCVEEVLLRLADIRIGALIVAAPNHASAVPHVDIVLPLTCSGSNRGSSGVIVQAGSCGSRQVFWAPLQIEFWSGGEVYRLI